MRIQKFHVLFHNGKEKKLIEENTSKVSEKSENKCKKTLDFNDDGEVYHTSGIPNDESLFIFKIFYLCVCVCV